MIAGDPPLEEGGHDLAEDGQDREEDGQDEVALDSGGDADGPPVIDLLEPAEGLPPVTATAEDLAAVAARLAAGTGPVAVDAERASGYRYGQKAYLVQLRRAGAGTVLIDPVACPDLSGLGAALADVEAVLHAASQDLPCLAEIGYQPGELFDTELAGRCSVTLGWRSAPCSRRCSASGWRRSTRPRTGPCARCPRRCSSTRHSTSRC